jgi:DNA-binding winged helix-turn-helix (wHTH) protein/tetratricopeptide (TPR) repeat protein
MASPARPQVVIRFGEFELNATGGELRKAGLPLKIHPQPFRVLLLLAERSGQIVTREEIQRTLWGDNTFVDFEGGINFCIKQIRDTIADNAEKPRYIETIPRRGYRFIASVTLVEPARHPIPFVRPPGSHSEPHLAAGHATDFASPHEIQVLPKPLSPALAIRSSRMAGAAIVALALIAILAVATIFYFHRAPKLTEKDSIVLADFTNTTGDAVFDGTLRQGLSVQLEQSPFLSLVSDERIEQTLRLMNQPAGAKLTSQIARDICERTGSAAVLSGSIASLGSQYVLGVRAVNCTTGDTLAEEQAQAPRKEDVLKSLSYASAKLREKLGESLSTVQKLDTPLEQATTPSLEALQAYSRGRIALAKGESATAVPLYRRATQLDPSFAVAYAALGMAYSNLGQGNLARESTKKAYQLRSQVSEQERFYIESHYQDLVVGDLEKARQVYELWEQAYPRAWMPPSDLSVIYSILGQHEKALAEQRLALRLTPGSGVEYAGLIARCVSLNRLAEARTAAQEAKAKNLDSSSLRLRLFRLDFLLNDDFGMQEDLAWGAGKPGVEDTLLAYAADTAAYSGQLAKARELFRRAEEAAERADEMETATKYATMSDLREAFFGNEDAARRETILTVQRFPGFDPLYFEALALAFAGHPAKT